MACASCHELVGDEPVSRAKALRELNRMKRSLEGWLKYRLMNDRAGDIAARDWAGEQELAEHLHGLLSEVYPRRLPSPDIQTDRNAAVALASIALQERLLDIQPQGMGIIPLIVGGVVLLGFSSWITSRAEVQKHKELMAAVARGEIEDPGAWKHTAALGAVAVAGLFIWFKWGNTIKGKSTTRKRAVRKKTTRKRKR